MLDTLGKFRHARGFSLGGEKLDTLGVLARSVEKDGLQGGERLDSEFPAG